MFRQSALFVVALATASFAAASPAVAATPPIQYVALGDSYTAGQGAAPYSDLLCLRSPRGYPAVVDALQGVALKANVACSGARTSDIPAQLAAIPVGAVGLVTLTVGGIDAGSNQVALLCATGDLRAPGCSDAVTITPTEEATIRAGLATAYAAVKAKYPGVRTAVMGYPKMFGGLFLLASFPRALNASDVKLDGIISSEAAKAGLLYVDVIGEFSGHEIGTARPWINYGSSDPAADFHPNATGYKYGYYQALVNDKLLPAD